MDQADSAHTSTRAQAPALPPGGGGGGGLIYDLVAVCKVASVFHNWSFRWRLTKERRLELEIETGRERPGKPWSVPDRGTTPRRLVAGEDRHTNKSNITHKK
jgi:hypothetical protein